MAATPNAIAQKTRAKLRVLVVGLFKKQFEMLKREYGRDLDLYATFNENNGGNIPRIGTMVDADRVVFMNRFNKHATQDIVYDHFDKSKITHCHGAFSDLRRILDGLATYSRMIAPTPVRAVKIETPVDALVDYSPFRTCKPGDVLEFIRPEHVAAHVFAQNVNEARRFYETNGGVQSHCEIKGGKARVVIVDRVRPMLEQAEAALLGEPVELALSFEDQRALEELFRDVYALSVKLSPHAKASHHATVANVAVDGWLEMFKTTGEK